VTIQLKQRIVGICVLLFLLLIIFPWLFGGPHPDFVSKTTDRNAAIAQANNVPSQPPTLDLQTQTIPVNNNPASDETKQSNPLNSSKQAAMSDKVPQMVSVSAPTHSSSMPSKPTEISASKLASIEKDIVLSTAPTKKHANKIKKPQQVTIKLKEPDLKKIKLHPVAKLPVPKTPEKIWLIRLGCFGNKVNAEKLVKQLKAHGYSAHSKAGQDAKGTRVYVGPETQKNAQTKIKMIAKEFKLQGVIEKQL
jgi:cell division septation protein DedD